MRVEGLDSDGPNAVFSIFLMWCVMKAQWRCYLGAYVCDLKTVDLSTDHTVTEEYSLTSWFLCSSGQC